METIIEEELETQSVEDQEESKNPGWFQEFIEHHDFKRPQRGDIIKGEILDIRENSILLDVGLKRDAIVTSQDIDKVNEEFLEDLAIGDTVHVSVFRTPVGDEDLLVSLNRGIAYENWVKAEECLDNSDLLELNVIEQNKGGLLVMFENLRGFVPNSHIPALRRGAKKQQMKEIKEEIIGEVLPLKAIEVNRKQRRLVFSARVAQKEQRRKRLEELAEGDIIESQVVNVVDFGLFVDLQGVDGLVHKSEISWERVYDPSKYFKVGDDIKVKVVDIDVERERVSLSRKSMLPNPWEQLREKYSDGDLVDGKVVSVLDFGAFVELPEGLQGLVHVSELGYANMGDPKSVVRSGDEVLVRILNIDPGRERVSLSMRRVPVDEQLAWMMEDEDTDEELEPTEETEKAPEIEDTKETEKTDEKEKVTAEVEAEEAVEDIDEDSEVKEEEETHSQEVEEAETPSQESEEEPAPEENSLIDINIADVSALVDLPGVGPALAERIIQNRPYETLNELTEVKGLGAKSLEEFRDLITVSA